MPAGAVSGASVWYGRDLAQRPDEWIRRFSEAELAELDAAVRAFKAGGTALASIAPGNFPLPSLGAALADVLRELLEGRGFVLLRGLPLARYSREEQAIAYLGIGSYLGAARSQNAKGHLLGHVKDLGLDIRDPNVRYYQTSRKLGIPHRFGRHRGAALPANRPRPGGESFIASSMTLYNEILARRPDLLRCAVRAVSDRPARRSPRWHATLVRHPGIQLARRAALLHLRAAVHRVRAEEFPCRAPADARPDRSDGPHGRAGE
jgi:hypothetical protein